MARLESSYSAFAVRSRGLVRLDVSYSLARVASEKAELRVPLGDIALDLRYGSSLRATSEEVGVPIIRMGNISDGAFDLSELKYVRLSSKEEGRYKLHVGDILVNRTNTKELVGKSAAWDLVGTYVFASYLIRLRVDSSRADARYVAAWLNSPDARMQIDRVSRQAAGMTNINTRDIRALQIPLPPLKSQRRLATAIEEARAVYKARMTRASAILFEISREIQEFLGIESPVISRELTYAVPRDLVSLTSRLDVRHNNPIRLAAIRAVTDRPYVRLHDIIEVISSAATDGATGCLGLGDVSPGIGTLRRQNNEERKIVGALRFSRDDILYGRLRPELNKVWLADREGCCSPEFRVLRVASSTVDAGYVAAILRSQIVLDQMRYVASGNTLPRISDEDLLETVVPCPEIETQRHISALIRKQQDAASSLQIAAKGDWEAAKESFGKEALVAAGAQG